MKTSAEMAKICSLSSHLQGRKNSVDGGIYTPKHAKTRQKPRLLMA
jgi:hypothetical protein